MRTWSRATLRAWTSAMTMAALAACAQDRPGAPDGGTGHVVPPADAGTDASSAIDAGGDTRTCRTTPSTSNDDWIEAKNERCCGTGLVFIDPAVDPDDGGACEILAPPSVKLCAYCGDGTCTAPENRCNCPADCAGRDGG